ncbi:hypothetical protein [Bacillus marinisedimentorum]|uniref:hypothetical protein n=1 Tax=Bacillus marinisedimentorum TaxID=1821260 RepID=UPI0009F72CB2|nr:hypothetical protein [Bacillus marinisedimentorum]
MIKKLNSLLSFTLIFLAFFLYITGQNRAAHMNSADAMSHGKLDIPKAAQNIPSVSISVSQDPSGSWLLKTETKHFAFQPEKAGTDEASFQEGHAHIYVDGKKINRLYGNYYNLGELQSGRHEITVSLNSNNHALFTYEGKEISDSEIVFVE